MTDPIKAEPMAYLLSADGEPVQVSFQATYQHGFAGYTEAPLYTAAQLVEERRLAWNEAIEAAAGSICGLVAKHAKDATIADVADQLGQVIRAMSVPAIVEAGEHQPKEDSDASSD